MGMNEFLAECYDTESNLGIDPGQEDLEKQAAAEMLVEFTKQAGLNIDALNEDEIEYVYGEMVKAAEQGWSPYADDDITKTAEFQMSDFMGRVMAHAMVDEQTKIAASFAGAKDAILTGLHKAKRAVGIEDIQKGLGKHKGAIEELGKQKKMDTGAFRRMQDRFGDIQGAAHAERRAGRGQAWEGAKKLGLRVGLPAAGLAAAGGGAYAMNKKSFDEEFEETAQERAYAMLAEAGYEVEKQAGADIDALLNQRALEMLEEAGYPVNWE